MHLCSAVSTSEELISESVMMFLTNKSTSYSLGKITVLVQVRFRAT